MSADDLSRQNGKRRLPRTAFKPGQSGNPAGGKPGQRHAALVALDLIGQEGAEAVIRKVVEQALEGDARCAEILLRRVWPERKGRPLQFCLPPMSTAADIVLAAAAISNAMADGTITPDEAAVASTVVETHRRALETHELTSRVAAIEAKGIAS